MAISQDDDKPRGSIANKESMMLLFDKLSASGKRQSIKEMERLATKERKDAKGR